MDFQLIRIIISVVIWGDCANMNIHVHYQGDGIGSQACK